MPKNDRYQLDVPYEPGQTEIKIQLQDLRPWERLEDVHVAFPFTGGESSSIGVATDGSPALDVPPGKTLRFDRVTSSSWPSQQTVRITGRVVQMPLGEYVKRLVGTEDE